ncbi:MAG: EamA family transporter [Acutalibacteraceae bacterium]|jgi:drug/metabolite transporter (DMT)-like permease
MVFILYFTNVAFSSGQSVLGKVYTSKNDNPLEFNINKAIAALIVFAALGIYGNISLHIPTVIYGACYGAFLCFSMHAGLKALSMGPIALTSILASFSLIIPFLFGIFVLREPITVYGIIGVVLLFVAIIMINGKKEKGLSLKWWAFALLTLISNGICSLVQKFHQINFPKQQRIEFMLASMITVLIILMLLNFTKRERKKLCLRTTGLLSGVMNGTANYIILYLAATEKASVLFPVISVINVISIFAIGRIFFKERLKLSQIIGLVFGLASVVLLNL